MRLMYLGAMDIVSQLRAKAQLRLRERIATRFGLTRPPRDTARHDPSKIVLGRHSYAEGAETILYDRSGTTSLVTVGNFCSIAYGVRFMLDGGHRSDFVTTSPFFALGFFGPDGHNASRGSITIEHDVWIGRDAWILSGIVIGTGAVVGARSVVTRDVAPYTVVAGNPAKVIRRRFTDERCDMLLASKWWDWTDDKILAARSDLWSADVDGFARRWLS